MANFARWAGQGRKSIPKAAASSVPKRTRQATAQALDDAARHEARAAAAAGTSSAAGAGATRGVESTAGSVSGMFGPADDRGTMSTFFGNMGTRLGNKFGDGRGIAKAAGGHALRGAVAGGAIGGVTESAQGGSFWDGAKSGAFNGAVGWSAYRMAGHAVGATSKNPFSKNGAFRQMGQQYSGVSKQVSAIVKAKQASALAAKNNGLG